MSLAKLSLDTSVDLIAKGIEGEFKRLITERLMAVVTPIVEQAASDAAKNIVSRVDAYSNTMKGTTEVLVRFNEKTL